MTTLTTRINPSDLVGAKVLRSCTIAGSERKPGDRVTAQEIRTINSANFDAMQRNNYFTPFYGNGEPDLPTERYIIKRPDLRYDVIEGHKLNDEPLNKQDAEDLLHP